MGAPGAPGAGCSFPLFLSCAPHARSASLPLWSPWYALHLGIGLGGGQRGACNVPPPRGQQTGNGQNVRCHSLDRLYASMITQKTNKQKTTLGSIVRNIFQCAGHLHAALCKPLAFSSLSGLSLLWPTTWALEQRRIALVFPQYPKILDVNQVHVPHVGPPIGFQGKNLEYTYSSVAAYEDAKSAQLHGRKGGR